MKIAHTVLAALLLAPLAALHTAEWNEREVIFFFGLFRRIRG